MRAFYKNKKTLQTIIICRVFNIKMVRVKGLEPPRCQPPDPKSGASANSATLAQSIKSLYKIMHEKAILNLDMLHRDCRCANKNKLIFADKHSKIILTYLIPKERLH